MLLNQLVEVNQKGLVARAVSFSLMDVPDKNLKLCEGFVFNHDSDANRAKNTTVGILHAIRHSFHSASKPNVHLIVQDYGKGKSHFALTVANFFKHPYSSDEVQGILAQLRSAAGENSYVYEDLLAYKKLGNHLVLCLSAEDVIDMRKHFFKVLNQELEKHGITDTISQQNCREPLNFLQKLDSNERQKAEAYLKANFSTTLSDVERKLSENDFKAVAIAKEICIHVKGVTPDFSGEILVKDTIDELITNHCGSGKRFNGILILFDELYEYLQKWTADPIGAGGLFLQNITQACQDHSNKITLVSLTQKISLSLSLLSYSVKKFILNSYSSIKKPLLTSSGNLIAICCQASSSVLAVTKYSSKLELITHLKSRSSKPAESNDSINDKGFSSCMSSNFPSLTY